MSKRKLLLADDSVTIQKVVNLTFADEGIEVIAVGDGDSAMAKVVELSPDLVMADVNMPGLNGYEICEKIRKDDELRQTPVILLVGSFEPFDEDEARRVGADDFLTKPFQSIRQLVNKVTVLLNSEHLQNGNSEAVSAKSYEDTLEMEHTIRDIPVPEPPKFEDSGFDDEMIQTSQVAGYALDESQKFETRSASASADDDFAKTQPLTNEEIREFNLAEPSLEDKFNEADELVKSFAGDEETQPAEARVEDVETAGYDTESESELHRTFDENEVEEPVQSEEPVSYETGREPEASVESAGVADNEVSGQDEEAVSDFAAVPNYETAGETELAVESPAEETAGEPQERVEMIETPTEESSETAADSTGYDEPAETAEASDSTQVEAAPEDEIPLPEVASVLESDEDDLLELPPIETDYDEESAEEEVIETGQSAGSVEVTAGTAAAADQISPELIEAIANRVVEKLSEKAVKEVAWEVVPQMTELIVKKMAEEKLKE